MWGDDYHSESEKRGQELFENYVNNLLHEQVNWCGQAHAVNMTQIVVDDPDLYDRIVTAAKATLTREPDGFCFDTAMPKHMMSVYVSIEGQVAKAFEEKYLGKHKVELPQPKPRTPPPPKRRRRQQ